MLELHKLAERRGFALVAEDAALLGSGGRNRARLLLLARFVSQILGLWSAFGERSQIFFVQDVRVGGAAKGGIAGHAVASAAEGLLGGGALDTLPLGLAVGAETAASAEGGGRDRDIVLGCRLYAPLLSMVVVVQQAKDGVVLDVGGALVDHAKAALALRELGRGQVHLEAGEQVLQDGGLDAAAADLVNLAQGLNDLRLLAVEVVEYQRGGHALARSGEDRLPVGAQRARLHRRLEGGDRDDVLCDW